MKSKTLTIKNQITESDLAIIADIDPNFIAVFFAPKFATQDDLQTLSKKFPNIPVVGCSTAGEIEETRFTDGTMSIMAMHFDHTPLVAKSAIITDAAHSYQAAHDLGTSLAAPDLAGVFVLAPGLGVNGSEITKGLYTAVGKKPLIFGGLAGDSTAFKKTHTFFNGTLSTNALIAVGLYGDNIQIKSGSKGGWSKFGPTRRVTRSEGSVLYELDGKPALDLYKEYLGDKAADLPSSGLLYPFSILGKDGNESGLIRTILDVDHTAKSLILAGDLAEGSNVSLMHADIDELINGAEQAAQAVTFDTDENSIAILISCVGRRIIMADDVVEEIEAVNQVLGDNACAAGFYSYGEIGTFAGSGKVELHNQTMTITHLSEK